MAKTVRLTTPRVSTRSSREEAVSHLVQRDGKPEKRLKATSYPQSVPRPLGLLWDRKLIPGAPDQAWIWIHVFQSLSQQCNMHKFFNETIASEQRLYAELM